MSRASLLQSRLESRRRLRKPLGLVAEDSSSPGRSSEPVHAVGSSGFAFSARTCPLLGWQPARAAQTRPDATGRHGTSRTFHGSPPPVKGQDAEGGRTRQSVASDVGRRAPGRSGSGRDPDRSAEGASSPLSASSGRPAPQPTRSAPRPTNGSRPTSDEDRGERARRVLDPARERQEARDEQVPQPARGSRPPARCAAPRPPGRRRNSSP